MRPSEDARGPDDDAFRFDLTPGETLFEAEARVTLPEVPGEGVAAPPGSEFGRYKDTRVIGRGGMGAILEAKDPQLDRTVALKILLAEAGPDSVEQRKFLREARLAGRLEHPNIVPVHEVGVTAEGRPYFSMKLVRGRSLASLLSDLSGRPPGARGEWTRIRLLSMYLKICDAVAFAHSQRVIHRDLKPANIMVGEFGEVLLTDWGLARILDQPDSVEEEPVATPSLTESGETLVAPGLATADGVVIGTPAYMPPEQAQGDVSRIDERSDIFTLGAILYEMLTLTAPFQGDSALTMIAQAGRGALEPPSRRAPRESIPRELEAAVLKAMARRMEDRYASVLDLKRDIEAYLEGRTLAAARYTPAQRALKWALRHRAASLATLAVGLLAVAIWSAFDWRARQDVDRRAQAVLEEHSALARELEAARERLAAARPERLDDLVQANGEPRTEAVRTLYAAYSGALDVLDRLAALAGRAPTDAAREAIGPAGVDAERRELCLEVVEAAIRCGDDTLARLWVDRASAAGLDPAARAGALARIERSSRERIEADLAVARRILEDARKPAARGQVLEFSVTELVRRRSPDLVRFLLDGGYLESTADYQRRLAITVLGRLGDTRTEGANGRDPVEALCEILEGIDPASDVETGVAVVEALAHLGDPRAYDVVFRAIRRVGFNSGFWHRIAAAYDRIPVPAGRLASRAADEATLRDKLDAFNSLMAKGLYREALDVCERALEAWPDDPIILVNRGNARFFLKDFDGAVADYDAAIQRRPNDFAGAYANRAAVRLTRDRIEDALADLDRALEIEPDHVDAHVNRGTALSRLGRWDEAVREFDRALVLRPGQAEALAGRARGRARKNDLPGALADFDEAVLKNPWSVSSLAGRADVYTQLGRYDEAVADYTRAIEIDRHPALYVGRGNAQRERGDHERARKDFDAAIEMDPDCTPAYVNRAGLRWSLGDADGAASDYDVAVEKDPDDPKVLVLRASFKHRARGDVAGAIEDFGKAIELDPRHAEAYVRRADLRSDQEDPHGALADYDWAIHLDPGRVGTWIDRGLVRAALGDVEGAIADQSKALELDPDNLDALTNRIVLRLRSDDAAGARTDLERMVAVRPGDWRMWYYLGITRASTGARDEGIQALRRALDLAPDESKAVVRQALETVEKGG